MRMAFEKKNWRCRRSQRIEIISREIDDKYGAKAFQHFREADMQILESMKLKAKFQQATNVRVKKLTD
jgi:hypothetical protein